MKLIPLSELFPSFSAELQAALLACGEANLADQVQGLSVYECSYDSDCGAGYIRVESSGKLNSVESNIIGIRHGRTVAVQHPYDVYLDADNFDRVTGIELLDASALAEQLASFRAG
ncbi:MAG: hypothetical protein RL710_758 [Pseudomonadota bacterium]|jgi:uncharacterized protein YuzE